ncbi:high-affinity nicotinic acid transporter, partial [Pyricularia oryzae Y34]
WIMIVEGIPTIILGICVFFFLPNNAETAYFLTDNEKKAMVIRRTRQYGHTTSAQKFSKKDMNKAFADWKVWLFAAGQFGADTCLYGFSTFLPTIIRGIGSWSNAEVQLLTIPCYFLGAVSYMTTAYWSDRTQKRGVFCVGFALTTCVGYAILISPLPSGAHYFGCFLVATGFETTDAPRYIRGHATTLAMVAMAGAIYATMSWWLARENRLRDEGKVKPEHQNLTEDEMAELGDESPRFRYAI